MPTSGKTVTRQAPAVLLFSQLGRRVPIPLVLLMLVLLSRLSSRPPTLLAALAQPVQPHPPFLAPRLTRPLISLSRPSLARVLMAPSLAKPLTLLRDLGVAHRLH